MADTTDQQPNRLTVEVLAARIEEDMASLYSAFMAKLVKTESGRHSTVIEEYIGDRFDVRARWYLFAVRKESHVEPYLATLDWCVKKDVEALIAHFASSLSHRELVDARIIGRISFWKSEAMRRVRETAQGQRIRDAASPDATVGFSGQEPSGAQPLTSELSLDTGQAAVSDEAPTAAIGANRDVQVVRTVGVPQLEDVPKAALSGPDSTVAQLLASDGGLDFISEAARNTAVEAYTSVWACSEASLARTAKVDTADLSKWKKGSLPAKSEKRTRIENALRNNDAPTPVVRRSVDI